MFDERDERNSGRCGGLCEGHLAANRASEIAFQQSVASRTEAEVATDIVEWHHRPRETERIFDDWRKPWFVVPENRA